MKPLKIFTGVITLVLVLVAGIGLASTENTSARSVPTARANAILTSTPSSADVAAITNVIVESYAVRVRGLKTFDTSQYPTVFIDDPSAPLSGEQADYLSKVRVRYGNVMRAINGNGWLTYNLAQIVEREQSLNAQQQVQAAARVQGRPPTSDEIRSAADVNGQPPASIIYEGSGKQKVNIIKANVMGNRAEVEYDNGAATYSVTLVMTANGWRIAGENILKVHL